MLLFAFIFIGCGNQETPDAETDRPEVSTTESLEPTPSEPDEREPIKAEDIDWKIGSFILWDEPILSLEYTNNSEYTIVDLELEFALKDSLAEKQLAFFNDITDDINDLHVYGYNRKVADPGETVKNSPFGIDGDYFLAKNIEQFELMEPDNMQIAYIGSDNRLHAVYYDYKTQMLSEHNDAEEMHKWSDSEISKPLSIPESRIVDINFDREDYFSFTIYDAQKEQFDLYIYIGV
jgi:hypothetical protein